MNTANRNTYILWKTFYKTYPAGQRSLEKIMAVYHEGFKEINLDGSICSKSDLIKRTTNYLGTPLVYYCCSSSI